VDIVFNHPGISPGDAKDFQFMEQSSSHYSTDTGIHSGRIAPRGHDTDLGYFLLHGLVLMGQILAAKVLY